MHLGNGAHRKGKIMSQTCPRCYKIVERPCQSDTERADCPNLRRKAWHIGEYYGLSNFPYLIRDEDGKAVAEVMTAEDAQRLIEAVNR